MPERDALVDAAVNSACAIGLGAGKNVGPGVVVSGLFVVSWRCVVFHV
jgi:hypothetical protein